MDENTRDPITQQAQGDEGNHDQPASGCMVVERLQHASACGRIDDTLIGEVVSPRILEQLPVEFLPLAIDVLVFTGQAYYEANGLLGRYRQVYPGHAAIFEAEALLLLAGRHDVKATEMFERSLVEDVASFGSWVTYGELLFERSLADDLLRLQQLSKGYADTGTEQYLALLHSLLLSDMMRFGHLLQSWTDSQQAIERLRSYLCEALATREEQSLALTLFDTLEDRDSIENRETEARIYLRTDPYKAASILRGIVEEKPDRARSRFMLGSAWWHCKRYDLALHQFEVTVALIPWDKVAKRFVGWCSLKMGDAKRALEIAEEELRHDPEAPDAQKLRRLSRRFLGQ